MSPTRSPLNHTGGAANLKARVISWRSMTHMFPTPVLTQLFHPRQRATFLTSFCSGERQKYTGNKVCLNRGSKSQPPGHEFDTEPTNKKQTNENIKIWRIDFDNNLGIENYLQKSCPFPNLSKCRSHFKIGSVKSSDFQPSPFD